MRRSPNPDQRRRVLCDAAIRLLAEDGVKGVTHLKVDRKVGMPDGTTSFYFRTSAALLRAVADRVAELDLKDLTAATGEPPDPSQPSGLAKLVIRSVTGVRLARTRARNELALQASRDPVLADALRHYTDSFSALIRDTVIRLQLPGGDDPAVVDEQTYAIRMFLGGVMLALASGDRRIRTADELDLLISGIVRGIGEDARRDLRAGADRGTVGPEDKAPTTSSPR
ncbi:TetR/AcrR family transcriptional regulator [Mycobacterium sp. 21AC1]|uniref:TetR/AcrR family transcriptional regulator n=1 Tax=[Mycobacterium] appelbergii TaxID=2939269 RepID=UPI002938EC23|nr:TetR/AcrR family transcriptional regulator [Mycobacterium sp. 21AC1]MDV3126708.1 TetR/AcrR family transcriptional regulator [Mycobacterium sp. 21AC1]